MLTATGTAEDDNAWEDIPAELPTTGKADGKALFATGTGATAHAWENVPAPANDSIQPQMLNANNEPSNGKIYEATSRDRRLVGG